MVTLWSKLLRHLKKLSNEIISFLSVSKLSNKILSSELIYSFKEDCSLRFIIFSPCFIYLLKKEIISPKVTLSFNLTSIALYIASTSGKVK